MKIDYSFFYELFVSCFENSDELLSEAKILFDNGKYPRAYTLAHLSIEESAKLPMINTYMYHYLHGEERDIKPLISRMRDHKDKIAMSSFLTIEGEYNGAEEVKELKKHVNDLNNNKNNSIYVGIMNNIIVKPIEIFDKSAAEQKIYEAESHNEKHRHYAALKEEEFKNIHKSPLFKRLSEIK